MTTEDQKAYNRNRQREWRKKNPAYKQYAKNWKAENSDKNKSITKQWKLDNAEHCSEYKKDWYKRNPTALFLKGAKARAKQFNVPCSIKRCDIVLPDICPILGIPLVFGDGKRTDNSPSLDRIIPKLGYVVGNIAVISFRANMIKSLGTADEHRKIAHYIENKGVISH